MSEIKFEKKLLKFIEKLDKIPEDFFTKAENNEEVMWLLDREDGTAGSYETSQERFGITKTGKILWGFSSGCSCWSGWDKNDYEKPVTWKEFTVLDTKEEEKSETWEDEKYTRDGWGFVISWQDEVDKSITDLELIFKKRITVEEVLAVRNNELKCYLIRRIGYDKIKDKAKIIHKQGDYELIDIKTGEDNEVNRFVKVIDSSSGRIYLLHVNNFVNTCKGAIASTFGLDENDYNPILES